MRPAQASEKSSRMESMAGRIDDSRDALPQTDKSGLLSQAQSGDSEAFGRLVEPHIRQLYRIALKITRNHEDAEDVCQNSMVKAFTNIRAFRGSSRFSTWLMRIGMNEALMKLRKRRSEARHISFNEGYLPAIPYIAGIPDNRTTANPLALCARGERIAMLWEAIGELETKSKAAIWSYGFQEKGTQEMAVSLNLSKSGVKSRLSRAMGQLRTIMAKRITQRTPPVAGASRANHGDYRKKASFA
jgi:RNA polymerase sigma-70 factor, ECF subfamily